MDIKQRLLKSELVIIGFDLKIDNNSKVEKKKKKNDNTYHQAHSRAAY